MSMTITNINTANVILKDAQFQEDPLTFAGAATVLAGTILARDSVSLKLVPFVKGGSTNENGIPKAVITYAVTAAGAGDEQVRAMVSGSVREELLIIDADGDASNLDQAVTDQLRAYGIVPVNITELAIQDNQ